jgi:hypothetical protein
MYDLGAIKVLNAQAELKEANAKGWAVHTRGHYIIVDGPHLRASFDVTERARLEQFYHYAGIHRIPSVIAQMVRNHADQYAQHTALA